MAELVQISKILRQKRAEKKLSLEQLSENTRISIIIIRKIESCDFNSVSDVYLRAYLIQYAQYLGCDEVLEMIDDVLPPKSAAIKDAALKKKSLFNKSNGLESSPTIHISKSHDNSHHNPIFTVKNTFIIVCIILAPLLFIRGCKNVKNIITNNIEKRKTQKEISIKELNKPESKKEKKVEPAKEAISSAKPIKKKSIQEQLRNSSKKTPSLRIMTKTNVFVRVKADDVLIFKSIVLKGSQESWRADKKLEVMISKPSQVLLEIFGKTIPTKNFKKPVTYIVTPKGFNTKK